jgi:hypothetical protein
MKTTKYTLGFFLVMLLGINAFASGNKIEENKKASKLNSTLVTLLNSYELENPNGGIALLNYTIDVDGKIAINNLEASDEKMSAYVYKHLDGKTLKISDEILPGEHTLKVIIKSDY